MLDELLILLLVLGVLLALVIVVGHGTWLLLAAIFRAFRRWLLDIEPPVQPDARACPACGHPQSVVGGRCRFCGATVQQTTEPSADADLAATRRQLDRWLAAGVISHQQHEHLIGLVDQEQRRAAETVAAPGVQPAQREPVTTGQVQPEAPVAGTAAEQDEVFEAEVIEPEVAATSGAAGVASQPAAAERHPLDEPVQEETAAAPSRVRPALADVLHTFLEEKNIRWGELISGLLIVGSAIGLVISLRHTIVELSQAIPYLPVFLFLLGTAAIHGAGNYTLRRWNLHSTSRGLLIIATLLVPLNFAAALVLSEAGDQPLPVTHPAYLAAALLALAGYGAMTYFSGRALAPNGWPWIVVGVMGPSAGQLLIHRLAGLAVQAGWGAANLLVALPLATYLAATLGLVVQARRWPRLSRRRSALLLIVLGVAVFSLMVSIGLLLVTSGDIPLAAARLAPSVGLAAVAVMAVGLLMHERCTAAALVKLRTTGTTLAVLGGFWMAASVALVVHNQHYLVGGLYALCIAALWLAGAVLYRRPELMAAFEGMTGAALLLLLCDAGLRNQWWDGTLVDLRFLPVQAAVLAGWCLPWALVRRLGAARSRLVAELMQVKPAVDQPVLGAVVVIVALLAARACVPGVLRELDLSVAMQQLPVMPAGANWQLWLATCVAAAALATSLWERPTRAGLLGAATVGLSAAVLAGLELGGTWHTATAVRWTLAAYTLVVVAVLSCRTTLAAWLEQHGWRGWSELDNDAVDLTRAFGLLVPGLPLLVLSLLAAGQLATGAELAGASGGQLVIWRLVFSYAGPLLLVIVALVGCALRERVPRFMLAGSAVLLLTTALATFLVWAAAAAPLDMRLAIDMAHYGALAMAVYTLFWLSLDQLLPGRVVEGRGTESSDLMAQCGVATGLAIVLGVWASAAVVAASWWQVDGVQRLGSLPACAAALAAAVAALWCWRDELDRYGVGMIGGLAMVLCGLVAARAADPNADWLAVRVLLVGWLVVAAAATAAFWSARRWLAAHDTDTAGRWPALARAAVRDGPTWANVVAALLVLLCLLVAVDDPVVWWPASGLAGVAVLAVVLAICRRRAGYTYGTAVLAAAVVTLLWFDIHTSSWRVNSVPELVQQLLHVNLMAILLVACGWSWLDVWLQRRGQERLDPDWAAPTVERAAAVIAVSLLLIVMVGGLLITSVLAPEAGDEWDVSNGSAAGVLACLAALIVAGLWNRQATHVTAAAYAWLALALAVVVDQIHDLTNMRPAGVTVCWALALAVQVALTGHLWKWGLNLAQLGSRLGMPQTVGRLESTSRWLPAASICVGAMAALLATGLVLGVDVRPETRWIRVSAGLAPLLVAYGLGSLAQPSRRLLMQQLALGCVSLTVVLLSWIDLDAAWQAAPVLEVLVRLLSATALLAGAMLWGAVRPPRVLAGWSAAMGRTSLMCTATSLASLAAVLMLEVLFFDPVTGVAFSHPYQPVIVALALVAVMCVLIVLALSPQLDPLKLSGAGRGSYVYAAEVVAALLFAHIYLARPMWFGGALRAWWPYIVLAIALAGAGTGELLRRYRLDVLAEPFQRSSAFLPLLPVLAFWVLGREHPLSYLANDISYPVVMLVVGLVYVVLCVVRRSMASGLAAAAAGNIALLAFYQDHHFSLLSHPQFWLIPPAVSVLVAAQINRDRLGTNALATVRYGAILMIYLSSTAEMIISSAEHQLWPPMVLAVLAVAGVLVGIMMRVRAFLYVGSSFVLLAVVSMVWHAARAIESVWPWWAFGMLMGLAMLGLFGLFELKRKEIRALVDQLKQWEK